MADFFDSKNIEFSSGDEFSLNSGQSSDAISTNSFAELIAANRFLLGIDFDSGEIAAGAQVNSQYMQPASGQPWWGTAYDAAAMASNPGNSSYSGKIKSINTNGKGYLIMKSACKEAGVPESWANSFALWDLLMKESSSTPDRLNPTLKNPSSSAYGIFQFMDSTWKGYPYAKTSDAYQQCVNGLRYIKQRYGVPEKALAFWLKRVPINGKDVGNWY